MNNQPYPYSFHIALDGNGINGLEGMAGTCLFLFNPEDNSYAFKVQYYDGIAAGHWVSVNPEGTIGFLGNVGQHLLFYDARTLDEIDRISTLRFEANDTSLRGSTHLVWLNKDESPLWPTRRSARSRGLGPKNWRSDPHRAPRDLLARAHPSQEKLVLCDDIQSTASRLRGLPRVGDGIPKRICL